MPIQSELSSIQIEAIIIPKICSPLPNVRLDPPIYKLDSNCFLANPE